jgi:cysteine desulfurase/selenocysteine lyase
VRAQVHYFLRVTVSEILSNEELRLKEFPVAKEMVFLAHAGDCPLPARVADAIAHYARQCTAGDQEKFVYPGVLNEGRKLVSQLLKCQPDEIAFVGPTSLALSLIASGLKFRRGENILIYFEDYPSNVYPWLAMAEQGVEVRVMNIRELGVIRPKDVMGQVDENTRLVALASCHFISGYRLDHQAIGKYLRERNILFCLDAIQTLGAFPTTVENVDMLAADAHKWMLGPCGAGILYVNKAVQDRLNPPIYGWNNVRCPNYVAQTEIVFRPGSQKYEAGTHNLLGMVGLVAALELLMEVGGENISKELWRKRAWLASAIQAKGYSVLQGNLPADNSGSILSFFKPGGDMPGTHQKLMDAQIFTSLRTDRTGQKYIRLSPHFYNTDAELGRVLELL